MQIELSDLTFDQRDEFKRKSIAQNVIKLLSDDSVDISPMVIDGSWGTGKTEFCHKLINLMKEQNSHNLIYIDAFKADHVNEPLMTVLAEIVKLLPENNRANFIKKIIPTVRFSLKTIAKAGVSHILRQDFADVVRDFEEDIEAATDKAIDATAELLLKDHIEAERNLQTLQNALVSISENKPIVVFVDELDRCKPSFAIEMLEIIKHTFDVTGVNFVLVTNTQQLKASINHCYGQAVDAQRYLDKFIKFRFELSPHSERNTPYPKNASTDYFFQLIKNINLESLSSEFYHAAKDLIIVRNLSLREVDTLSTHINICQTLSNNSAFNDHQRPIYSILSLITVALACFKPNLLNKINNSTVEAIEIGEFLGVTKLPELDNGNIKATTDKSAIVSHSFTIVMAIISRHLKDTSNNYLITDSQQTQWDRYISYSYKIEPEEAINHIKHISKILSLE